MIIFEKVSQFSISEAYNTQSSNEWLPKVMRFFHNVIKRFLHDQNYRQVGVLPRVYNPQEQKNVNITGRTVDEILYKLIVWPGYEFRVQSLGQQFFLNVDTSTKFLQQKTVLDRIK